MKLRYFLISPVVCIIFLMILLSGCGAPDRGGTEVGNPVREEIIETPDLGDPTSPETVPPDDASPSDESVPSDDAAPADKSSGDDVDSHVSDMTLAELEAYLKVQHAENIVPAPVFNIVEELDQFENATPQTKYSSRTSLQEMGVDEADKVKTVHVSGETFMYIAEADNVFMMRIYPRENESLIRSIQFDGIVETLQAYGTLLIILYTPNSADRETVVYDTVGPLNGSETYHITTKIQTGIMIVDVENPDSPTTLKHLIIDGELKTSRLIRNHLYVVQQFYPDLPDLEHFYDGTCEHREKVVAANRDILATLTFNELSPQIAEYNEKGEMTFQHTAITPNHFYIPEAPNGASITTVIDVTVDDPQLPYQTTGIVADVHTIYASMTSLYLTATVYTKEPQTMDEVTGNFYTQIIKLKLDDGPIVWGGERRIIGMLHNRFSMSEYKDVLRVIVTNGNIWDDPFTMENNLFCFTSEEDELTLAGKLTHLFPDEAVCFTRFIDHLAYVATYTSDKVTIIDLSDPAAPELAGRLNIPGCSIYIYPLDEQHVLTFGKDTITDARLISYNQGLFLKIFDVSDPSEPIALGGAYQLGDRWSESEAIYNHKALTFWPSQELMALPVDLYEQVSEPETLFQPGELTFSGLIIFHVTIEGGITERGRISTATGGSFPQNIYSPWMRGVFIEDLVYAVTPYGVWVDEWDKLDMAEFLPFREDL